MSLALGWRCGTLQLLALLVQQLLDMYCWRLARVLGTRTKPSGQSPPDTVPQAHHLTRPYLTRNQPSNEQNCARKTLPPPHHSTSDGRDVTGADEERCSPFDKQTPDEHAVRRRAYLPNVVLARLHLCVVPLAHGRGRTFRSFPPSPRSGSSSL